MKKAKTYMDFLTMSHRAAAREAADLTAQLLEVKAENAELTAQLLEARTENAELTSVRDIQR